MKIDFLISSLHGGGAERVMVILADNLAIKGHDVSIITFVDNDFYEVNEKVNRVKLYHGSFKNHKIRSLINLNKYYKVKSNRPAILISFIPHNNLIAILIGKIYSIKLIISEHSNHLQTQFPKWLTSLTRNILYRFSDTLTVLTKFDIEFYKNKGAKVIVMPNPCTFKPLDTKRINRNKTILAVGNLNRYQIKGFDNLISIIAPVLIKFPNWKLQILGDGETGMSYLKELAKNCGIENKVEFLGFQSKVQDYMQTAEIFVLSSRYEGLPMVLLEAMSQGMACIAYDCKTGPSDIIQDEYNGILIPDQDKVAMQQGLFRLLNSDDLRYLLGNNAIQSLDKYSVESIILKWENLFNEILTTK